MESVDAPERMVFAVLLVLPDQRDYLDQMVFLVCLVRRVTVVLPDPKVFADPQVNRDYEEKLENLVLSVFPENLVRLGPRVLVVNKVSKVLLDLAALMVPPDLKVTLDLREKLVHLVKKDALDQWVSPVPKVLWVLLAPKVPTANLVFPVCLVLMVFPVIPAKKVLPVTRV